MLALASSFSATFRDSSSALSIAASNSAFKLVASSVALMCFPSSLLSLALRSALNLAFSDSLSDFNSWSSLILDSCLSRDDCRLAKSASFDWIDSFKETISCLDALSSASLAFIDCFNDVISNSFISSCI